MLSLQSQQTYMRTIHYRPQIDDFKLVNFTRNLPKNEKVCIVPDFLETYFHIEDKYVSIDENGFYKVCDPNNHTIGRFQCLNNAAYAYMLYTESKIVDPVAYLEHLYGLKHSDICFV